MLNPQKMHRECLINPISGAILYKGGNFKIPQRTDSTLKKKGFFKMKVISPLQKVRAAYAPKLPPALRKGANVAVTAGEPTTAADNVEQIKALFPNTFGSPVLTFAQGSGAAVAAINVGVILSGGQAPGGHNVIAGLFDGIKSLNAGSKLYGFLKGPDGLVKDEAMELTADIIDDYRNTGGFDIIGSGRTKLETPEQFEAARKSCEERNISALVIIGGDDSNTNACVLAEYFKANKIGIQVIGCPKTIDGDLKNEWIEASFGFDTACRVYSELIGNIGRDANSAKKYWHFIKLMGRSASHIALECALQTQPNVAIISEEVAEKKMTLDETYAVRLGDTELYKNSPALHVLPEDTVLCLHEDLIGQKDYEKIVEAFKLISQLAPVTTKSDS